MAPRGKLSDPVINESAVQRSQHTDLQWSPSVSQLSVSFRHRQLMALIEIPQ